MSPQVATGRAGSPGATGPPDAGPDPGSPGWKLREQERMAREIRSGAVHTLFGVGMNLQAVASETADEVLRARLEAAVADLDRAIRELRDALFKSF
jgi:hypothetical protein